MTTETISGAQATDTLSGAFIGGRWVAGRGGHFEVRSPHKGPVHTVSRCNAEDVAEAVSAAKQAQPKWAATSVVERVEVLNRYHQLILEHAEEIAQMVTLETGKTINETREELWEYTAPAYQRAAEEILRFKGQTFPSTQERTNNKRLVLNHRPIGVVAVIAPYNFPTDISSIAIAHALAAGNTVVWKPSEYAPRSCAMVAELAEQAGVPAGVLNVIQGLGDAGAALVESDDVDGIFFTGSTATGMKIAERAGLKKLLLELGGDGPQIVLADADVDAAVAGAITGSFYLAGQVCTSAERILVHQDIYDEFVEKFESAIRKLNIGDPHDPATDMGPLCNETTLHRVRNHVADAVSRGARAIQHGPEEGLFYPATMLLDVPLDADIMKHETFGPVIPVIKIHNAQEAIDIANSSGLGLVASLWTKDLATAWRVAEALPHGAVNINESNNFWDQLAPFGGAGKSGVGRELATNFFDTFMEPKLLVFDLGDGVRGGRRTSNAW
ncbi:aldehyde dehydrogenase family protein [Arthrobacter sp. NyZ413]|uniref:aldehyde dehydrogenase family protein n=1 Tax=Arthrobacter sp. NyZ413 TaxID=3144669 RepID=UPI003BF7C1FA